jgi:hypothetical protein
MTSSRKFKRYNLREDYFRELVRDPADESPDFRNSPLVTARKRLASYVSVVLWNLYKSDVELFGDCFTLMDRISKTDDSFDELTSDALEEVVVEFRQAMVKLHDERPTLKDADFEEFLEEFDRLLKAVKAAKAQRHGLAGSLQRHFYYTVFMAEEGRRDKLFKAHAWDERDVIPRALKRAAIARDRFYLSASANAGEAYLGAVSELMEEPSYAEWLTQAVLEKPHLEPLPLEQLPELHESLEVELLWFKETAP